MRKIDEFINNVRNGRKRTGLVYCSDSFSSVIKDFQGLIPEILVFDCTRLFKDSLTFSASDLLSQIESKTLNSPYIVCNMETFIVSNSSHFLDQVARLLILKEPILPLFFLFYSKELYIHIKSYYESKELTVNNVFEV
jgi:hypothetical protein